LSDKPRKGDGAGAADAAAAATGVVGDITITAVVRCATAIAPSRCVPRARE